MAPFIIPVALVAGGYAVGRGIEAGVKALHKSYKGKNLSSNRAAATAPAAAPVTPPAAPAASPTEPAAPAPAEAAIPSATNEENASAEAVAQEIEDLGRGLEELEAALGAAQASSAVHAWFLAGKALHNAALGTLGNAWVAYREAYNTCLTFGLSEDTLTAITEDFRENEEYLGGFIQEHFADCADGVGCAERGDLNATAFDDVRRHTACLEECMRRMSVPEDKLARVSALVARLDAVVDNVRDAYIKASITFDRALTRTPRASVLAVSSAYEAMQTAASAVWAVAPEATETGKLCRESFSAYEDAYATWKDVWIAKVDQLVEVNEAHEAYTAATTAAYQYVATATSRMSATQRRHAEELLERLDAAEKVFCDQGGDDAEALTKGADARRLIAKRISKARKG